MKVLSLFDGMACGYEALLRAWIQIEKYYASEIDKYAMQIATKNHPDIIEIWDVTQVKWEDYKDVDLLIGGSPCQWFSVAGKMLNFNDPRSKLFFEFVRLKNEIKPKYFLLENVKMKKEWQDIISEYLWVQPIEINSALVSAQNRRRLYWTNIPWIQQPQDRWILLKDILQREVDDKYVYTEERWKALIDNPHNHDILKRTENVEWKCNTLTTVTWGNQEKKIEIAVGGWLRIKQATKKWYIEANDWDWVNLSFPNSTTRRGRVIKWKSSTLDCGWDAWVCEKVNWCAVRNQPTRNWLQTQLNIRKDEKSNCVVWSYADKLNQVKIWVRIRKLTPVECERLQTLPDNYTEWVSDSQRYKMLWNWWTVEVIAHIFRNINSWWLKEQPLFNI